MAQMKSCFRCFDVANACRSSRRRAGVNAAMRMSAVVIVIVVVAIVYSYIEMLEMMYFYYRKILLVAQLETFAPAQHETAVRTDQE